MAGNAKDNETPLDQQRQQHANNTNQQQATTRRKKKKNRRPQWKEAVAGAVAGACSRTVMAPVERIKLLLQLQGSISKEEKIVTTPTTNSKKATTSSAVISSTRSSSSSAWQVARTVYTEQGIRAFWRGNLPNVLRVSGTAAVNFTCLDYYKRIVVTPLLQRTLPLQQHGGNSSNAAEEQARKLSFRASFIAGGLAGATSTTVLYPLEFVRTRLAMDGGVSSTRRTFHGMWHTLSTIGRTDGIAGFFQGYGIALTGGVVYRVLYLGGYDAFKGEIMHYRRMKRIEEMGKKKNVETAEEPSLTWFERFGAAQFISLTAGTLSYPFDSVRRRMMMQAGKPVQERRYRNSIHCIKTVLQTEGYRGFFLGLGPNILRSFGGTLLLVGYDRIRTLL